MSAPDPKITDTIRITNVTTQFLKEINFERRGGRYLTLLSICPQSWLLKRGNL
jgi:hypothetical protein